MENTITIPNLLGDLTVENTEDNKAWLNNIACNLGIAARMLKGECPLSQEHCEVMANALMRDWKRITNALNEVGYFDKDK